jgi:hypothetical protein
MARRVVLVTGGTGDIGKEICLHLARRHQRVAFTYSSNAAAAAQLIADCLAAGIAENDICSFHADFRSAAGIQALVEHVVSRFGRIDVLINNAAVVHDTRDALAATFDDFVSTTAEAMAINATAPMHLSFLVAKRFRKQERLAGLPEEKEAGRIAGDDWVETHVGHTVKKVEVDVDGDEDDGWGGSDDDNDAKAPKQQGASEVRFYDVTVVYDQYYASPRVFLFGYDAQSQPLTKEEMMEDVYADNREKTVTVDPHPFLKAPCISIHPCRHAETMRRIIERFEIRMADEQEEAGVPESERVAFIFPTYLALFVFLKFIASVVPTISYDISVDLDM